MKVELDLGNSFVKWRLLSGVSVCSAGRVTYEDFQNCVDFAGWDGIRSVLYCSVVDEAREQKVIEHLKRIFDGAVFFKVAVSAECCGVRCAYEDVSALGVDRWLAIIGAYSKAGSACCVIDCGSCVTVDWVQSDGRHLGGWIWPGFNLNKNSLIGGTGRVRFNDFDLLASPVPGLSTQQCVENGVSFLFLSSLESLLRYAKSIGVGRFIVTGGDGELASSVIPGSVFVDDLVFQGLSLVGESTGGME